METVTDFLFLSSKITADGDCSHEIKRRLLLGRKAVTNLDSMLKSRDITLLTKVCLVKEIFFPGGMYGYESWAIKKAERRRIDAFELYCLWRLLRVPWTARRSNQSILKEVSPEYTPIVWPPDVNNWLTGKDPDAWKDWGQSEKRASVDEIAGWHHWCNGHELGQALGDNEGQAGLVCCSPWGCRVGHKWQLNNNNTGTIIILSMQMRSHIRSRSQSQAVTSESTF